MKVINGKNEGRNYFTNSSALPSRKKMEKEDMHNRTIGVVQTARPRPTISVDNNLENSFLDQRCENLTSRNAEFAQKDVMQKGLHRRQNTADPLSVIEMVTNGMYN